MPEIRGRGERGAREHGLLRARGGRGGGERAAEDRDSHLERLAVVYLRQSTPRQVREHFRSTERQYALAEEAARLGWQAERVVVIDGDLGVSGRDAEPRESYKELVSRVCLGEVGAILGLEVARLGRSSAEHHRLLEFCALTDTLIVDTDGSVGGTV